MSGVLLPYKKTTPTIAGDAFIAPNAMVIGDVIVGAESGIWFNCVLRGDVNKIVIGNRTNIQDGSVVHVSGVGKGTHIGNNVTVGHMALIHACSLEDGCFIGMSATVMDDCIVETGALVAAGALVAPGRRVLAGQVWGGTPARYLRDIRDTDIEMINYTVPRYVELANQYRKEYANY